MKLIVAKITGIRRETDKLPRNPVWHCKNDSSVNLCLSYACSEIHILAYSTHINVKLAIKTREKCNKIAFTIYTALLKFGLTHKNTHRYHIMNGKMGAKNQIAV